MSSAFDPSSPGGAVDSSGAAPGNHWAIEPPNTKDAGPSSREAMGTISTASTGYNWARGWKPPPASLRADTRTEHEATDGAGGAVISGCVVAACSTGVLGLC